MVEQAAAEGRPYALAFVDVRMPPGWDGIETVARIWQKFPELPVVICTAYSDYSWLEMTSKLGHSDNLVILRKPFEAIEVLQLAHAFTRNGSWPGKSGRTLRSWTAWCNHARAICRRPTRRCGIPRNVLPGRFATARCPRHCSTPGNSGTWTLTRASCG